MQEFATKGTKCAMGAEITNDGVLVLFVSLQTLTFSPEAAKQ
jgi:hypothetical protein